MSSNREQPADLLPCPFCGNRASIEAQFGREWWVQCATPDCASNGVLHGSPDSAKAAWNKRATQGTPKAEPPADVTDERLGFWIADAQAKCYGTLAQHRHVIAYALAQAQRPAPEPFAWASPVAVAHGGLVVVRIGERQPGDEHYTLPLYRAAQRPAEPVPELTPDVVSEIIQAAWNDRGPDVMLFGLAVAHRIEQAIRKAKT